MKIDMRSIRNARDAARLKFFPVLAAIVLTLFAASRGAAQTPAAVAGTASSVTGNAQFQRGAVVSGLAPGTPIDVGDRIITGPGGHAVITLTDGSRLEIGDSSNIVIDNHALAPAGGRTATRVSLFSGVLRSVANATGGTANFEVHTPNAVAAVRGTRWDTAYTEGESRPTYGDCHKFTDVVVYEGVVDIRNPTATNGIDVPAGYEVTVPCESGSTLPGPIGMTGARSMGGEGGNATTAGSGSPSLVGGAPPPGCPVCPPGG
jgi:ferric-dicitrate binding protein FerR (iron transport regulator)